MTDSVNSNVGVVEYERRHAELEQRIARLEMLVANLVTQKDLADFKAIVSTLQVSVGDFKATADQLPSRDEFKWQRWLLMVALGLIVYHMFGGTLPGLP